MHGDSRIGTDRSFSGALAAALALAWEAVAAALAKASAPAQANATVDSIKKFYTRGVGVFVIIIIIIIFDTAVLHVKPCHEMASSAMINPETIL